MRLVNVLVKLDTFSVRKIVPYPRYTSKHASNCWENKAYHESSYHTKKRLDLIHQKL